MQSSTREVINMEKKFTLRLLKTFKETIVDGIGLRYSLYFSGCTHKCKGCHNEYSWNPENGDTVTYEMLERIAEEINTNAMLDGITISGGDPLFNPEDMIKVLRFLKEKTGKDIWMYTGYTLEQIRKDEKRNACLEYVDVLVDGPFIKQLYTPDLQFKGSSNQRIIKKREFKKEISEIYFQ